METEELPQLADNIPDRSPWPKVDVPHLVLKPCGSNNGMVLSVKGIEDKVSQESN